MQSTGSSSDGYSVGSSSYDFPFDSTPMTLLNVPKISGKGKPLLQTGGIDWANEQAKAEWLQTIDINVILPTPSVSPCGSVRNISENLDQDDPHSLNVPTRGRSGSSVSVDSRECDTHSIGSDSVFFDEPSVEGESDYSDKGPRQTPDTKATFQGLAKARSGSLSKRQVHSFRLPINPKAALSPIPSLLEGKPLMKPQDSLSPESTAPNKFPVTSSLNIPLGVHLSGSCERLATHGALLSEYDNVSRQTSSGTICQGSSFEDDPVITAFTVPGVRRCNSATTPEIQEEAEDHRFKRADSDVPQVQRNGSADISRQNSSSSSGSDEVSESVSFHLLVPHLSVDCPSADTSRASSPSLSLSPPGSPSFGTSLSVPTSHFHRSSSPSRGRLRGAAADGRTSLKRQYSQYMPASPRDKSPSPFGLPTSFEEDEEAEAEKEREEEERKIAAALMRANHLNKVESNGFQDEDSKCLTEVSTLVIPAPEGYLSSSPEPERISDSRTKDLRDDSIEGEMKF